MPRADGGMTVADLRDALANLPDDMLVVTGCEADHSTQFAHIVMRTWTRVTEHNGESFFGIQADDGWQVCDLFPRDTYEEEDDAEY